MEAELHKTPTLILPRRCVEYSLMKSLLSFLIFSLCSSIICSAQPDNPVIKNVRLFDGDSVHQRVTVVVKKGLISSINEYPDFEVSGDVIDGTGYTLIPGLINAHFHTVSRKNLREAASNGVLCVLDMMLNPRIDYDKVKELSKSTDYPYFYSANNPVTVSGGHGTHWEIVTLKSKDETQDFVKDRISEGADFIKIMLDHGFRNNLPTLTDRMLDEAIKVSKSKNMLSVAHISRYEDAIKAVNLGVNGLAHIWLFDSIPIPDYEIQNMVSKNVFIVPTLHVYQKGVEIANNPTDMDYLKNEVLRLYKAGIPILAGTDPPNYEVNFGSDLIEELKLFVEMGISEIEALKTATSNASSNFHLGEIGYIKEGYSADFVLVQGNPLENIEDLYNIKGIWKKGKYLTPHNKH